ncbi:MAG: BrxA family protein [Dehalococcoidia bacterium]
MSEISRLVTPDSQPLTARLAEAGSRRSELETLLAAAPGSAGPKQYADLVLEENVAAKATAVSRTKLLRQLRARYSLDQSLPEFRGFRGAMACAGSAGERGLLCFLIMARCDRLFRELSLQLLQELRRPGSLLDAQAFREAFTAYLEEHGLHWTEATAALVGRHLLSSLKDFGILSGSTKRRFAPVRPGPIATSFAARLGYLEGLTGRQNLGSRWYRLLCLTAVQIPDFLLTAQRAGLLSLRMQADVVELTLPPEIPA